MILQDRQLVEANIVSFLLFVVKTMEANVGRTRNDNVRIEPIAPTSHLGRVKRGKFYVVQKAVGGFDCCCDIEMQFVRGEVILLG